MQAYGALLCADALLAQLVSLPCRAALSTLRLARGCTGRLAHAPQLRPLVEAFLGEGVLVAIFCVTVWVLYRQDMSVIYHFIRSQEIIKLYVLYSVLECCDQLLCSFSVDMLEALASSTSSLAALLAGDGDESPRSLRGVPLAEWALDVGLLAGSGCAHALVMLTQAITLAVAVNSSNNALLALLISTNFREVKGYVFKRMDAPRVVSAPRTCEPRRTSRAAAAASQSQLACQDAVERAHLAVYLAFICAQHVEASGSARAGLLHANLRLAAPLVLATEPLIDLLKHAFMAKFNDIGPDVYGGMLRELAGRAARVQAHEAHLVLGFAPLAPAALLLRALPPAAAACGARGAGAALLAFTTLGCLKLLLGKLARRVGCAILFAPATAAPAVESAAPATPAPRPPRVAVPPATPRFYGAASPRKGLKMQ
jgi:hypothetical protein